MDKRYCVYFHKRKTDGVVYYIGSGVQGKRESHFTKRSKSWHEVHDTFGTTIEIYKNKLSLDEARNIEKTLILSGDYPSIINKRLPVSSNYIDIEKVKDFIRYDEASPTYLVWIKKTGPRSKVGQPAGNLSIVDNKNRSAFIKINGTGYKISRLIWTMFNGDIPENMVIDHIDGNPFNNNILNLRCISSKINARNLESASGTLPSGIYENDTSFYSSVVNLKDRYFKSFSKKLYGDSALDRCKSWRVSKLKELGILDDYTERHLGFNPEYYLNLTFENKVISRTGFDNIWVKYKKNSVCLSAGFGRKDGKYVLVTDDCNYDTAIQICLKYLEDLRNNNITKPMPEYIYYEDCNIKYPRYRVAYKEGNVRKLRSFQIKKLFPYLPFEEAKQKTFELAKEFRDSKLKEFTENAA